MEQLQQQTERHHEQILQPDGQSVKIQQEKYEVKQKPRLPVRFQKHYLGRNHLQELDHHVN